MHGETLFSYINVYFVKNLQIFHFTFLFFWGQHSSLNGYSHFIVSGQGQLQVTLPIFG